MQWFSKCFTQKLPVVGISCISAVIVLIFFTETVNIDTLNEPWFIVWFQKFQKLYIFQ